MRLELQATQYLITFVKLNEIWPDVDFTWSKLWNVFHEYVTKTWYYMGADKSLVRPGRTQATATEDFDFHISHL